MLKYYDILCDTKSLACWEYSSFHKIEGEGVAEIEEVSSLVGLVLDRLVHIHTLDIIGIIYVCIICL